MDQLLETEAFCIGVSVGISLHQQRVIAAHDQKEPLRVGENLYYLESGKERLERMLSEICK